VRDRAPDVGVVAAAAPQPRRDRRDRRAGQGRVVPQLESAVRAHVGRLLADALPKGAESAAQKQLIDEALDWRPLPDERRGVAPTLSGLGGTWAMDKQYPTKLARIANEILRGAKEPAAP
jgi:hypothetical protein